MMTYLYTGFYFSAILLCLLLIGISSSEKQQTNAHKWLRGVLFVMTLCLVDTLTYSINLYKSLPHSLFLFSFCWYLLPAIMYLYVLHYFHPQGKLSAWHLLHLAPASLYILNGLDFYTTLPESKVKIGNLLATQTGNPGWMSFLFFGQNYLYLYLTHKILKQKKDTTQFKWIYQWWLFWVGVVIFDTGFLLSQFLFAYPIMPIKKGVIALYSLNVFFLVYWAIKKPVLLDIKREPSERKYSSSTLSDKQVLEKSYLLKDTIEEKKLFLKPNLKLSDLGQELQLNEVELSQILNVGLKQSFHELINRYRIQHAKRLIESQFLDRHNIEALALESGFGNKMSFYRHFKSITGKTPNQYRKMRNTTS